MSFYVYIIQSSKDRSFYVGVSSNPEERLEKHNRRHSGYTSRKRPWVLVYKESYATKTEALKRENFIKSQKSREFIEHLVGGSSAG